MFVANFTSDDMPAQRPGAHFSRKGRPALYMLEEMMLSSNTEDVMDINI